MLAIKGMYDGTSVKLLERIYEPQPQTVIVLFPEPQERIYNDDISSDELIKTSVNSGVFDFLGNSAEDIYSISDGEEVKWQS